MVAVSFLIASAFFLNVSAGSGAGTCYFPGSGRAWARGYEVCEPFSPVSFCCPQGYTCWTNRLCVVTDPSTANNTAPIGSTLRPACSNPSWDAAVCGDICLDEPEDDNRGDLIPCGNNVFCCGSDSRNKTCDCSSGQGTFSVKDGDPITIIGRPQLTPGASGVAFTATPMIPISSTGTNTRPTTFSSSETALPSTTSSSVPPKPPAKATNSLGLKIGLPIGIVALGIVAVLTYWFCIRKPIDRVETPDIEPAHTWQRGYTEQTNHGEETYPDTWTPEPDITRNRTPIQDINRSQQIMGQIGDNSDPSSPYHSPEAINSGFLNPTSSTRSSLLGNASRVRNEPDELPGVTPEEDISGLWQPVASANIEPQ